MFTKLAKTFLRFILCQAAIAALALICALPLWLLWAYGVQATVCGPALSYLTVAFLVATAFEALFALVVGVTTASNSVKWLVESLTEYAENPNVRRALRKLFGWD